THATTGGQEKKLRLYDLSRPNDPVEVGQGTHQGTIKSIIWTDPNTVVSAADDKTLRWWDLRSGNMIEKYGVEDLVGSCETAANGTVLTATAGKSVYFFEALSRKLIKSVKTAHDVSAVALHVNTRKFVTGGSSDTWVRIYDFDEEKELEVYKGHHGSVWSAQFSPDGKLYATGSEDGTIKLVSNRRCVLILQKKEGEC